MKFTKRNEQGLHCRFCGATRSKQNPLYETSPVSGIVCSLCKVHLGKYNVDSYCGHLRPVRDVLCQRTKNHPGRHRAVIFWEEE